MRFLSQQVAVSGRSHGGKATLPARCGQTALVAAGLAGAILLGGCSEPKPAAGVMGYVGTFAGFVSAEEPRAAMVGEDILSAGGTAADAATAMAATLTVTLPTRAGWLGGGVCLSRMPKDRTVKAFSFLPEPLPGGGFAPGLPRGLYALQAASGALRWEEILAPAEQIARFGTPVSRALAKDFEAIGSVSGLDAGMRAVYAPKGRFLAEGEPLAQPRLAAALSAVRMQGAGDAYVGGLGRLIAQAVPERDEERRTALRAYRARSTAAIEARFDNDTAYFPGAPFFGTAAVAAWKGQGKLLRPAGAPPYGATGFVVADRGGMAVACVLSMGQMFGGGQTYGDTGLTGYAALGEDFDAATMAPMLVGNTHLKDLRLAAAAAGAGAGADVMDFALAARRAGKSAAAAIAEVASRGDAGTRVTGVSCPDGAPGRVDNCTLAADSRGAGISRVVGREIKKKGHLFELF